MANIRISQLPTAPSAITGSELVPIVQSGQTVQTTIANILSAPTLTQTFLTKNQEPTLPNSRYFAVGSGLSLTDGGAQSTYTIGLTGAISTINALSNGVLVKSGSTVISRSIAVSGAGLSATNGDGVSGNPTIALTGNLLTLASASGTGLVAINGSSSLSILSIIGTTDQISVANGNGASGSPTIAIANNPVLPGSASLTLPIGGTAQRPAGVNGMIRYNTDLNAVEVYANSLWGTVASGVGVSSFSGGSTGLTPNTPTTGGIVLAGVLNASNGGTGASTLTGYVYGNGTGVMTASTTIPNAGLANSSITIGSTSVSLGGTITTLTGVSISGSTNTLTNIGNSSLTNSSVTYNGVTVALGASGTITAVNPNALTIGTGLSGTSYNGSSAVTIAIDSTVATLTGIQTLTNKTISGASNTLTNIGNSSLTNSSVTIGTTSISLGATSLTLGGLTSVTVTQDPVSALQLATKQYVDSVAQGLDAKASCVYGTTNNITLSGLGTQAGGDWASSLTAGDRILVKNQTSSQFNGIYVASSSTWTRALDMDVWAEVPSSFVFIETGSTLADTGWVTTANAGGTIDVTAMPWVQFSGAGTYTAGTGLTLTGSQFSLTAPVTTALGGTGSTSALTQYGVVYGSTTSAMATTSVGTSTQVLHGNASGAPTWSAVSLTADVTGTLPIASGGTNSTATPTAGGVGYGTGTAHAYSAVGTSGQILTSAGAGTPTWSTLSSVSVTTLSFGTTGLTPATATSGAITVAGTLVVGNGGTGVATLTGLAYGNGTSAFTSATAAQVVAVISTTAVTNATNATNLALTAGSGATNYITYSATATGNVPQYTSTGLTYNATNTALTGGINGGTF